MIKRIWKKMSDRSTFKTFLVTYMVLLLIPIVTILFFMNCFILPMLKERVTADNINTLKQIELVTDSNWLQLMSIQQQISLNKEMDVLDDLRDVNMACNMISELKQYNITNPFLLDIIIYFRGDNYIYTSTSSYTLENFVSKALKCPEWTEDQITEHIRQTSGMNAYFLENACYNGVERDLIMTTNKLKIYPNSKEATVLFLLDNDVLAALSETEHRNTQFVITNDSLIVSSMGADVVQKELFESMNKELEAEIFRQETSEWEEQKLLVCTFCSPETGLRYFSFTPLDEVLKPVTTVQLQMMGTIAILLFVGLIIIYYCMWANYRPIKQLSSYAGKLAVTPQTARNEFELIRNSVDSLADEYKQICEKAKISGKNHVLHKLLLGRFGTMDSFRQEAKQHGMDFNKNQFSVLMIIFTEPIDIESILRLENNLNTVLSGYLQIGNTRDRHLFIANLNDAEKEIYPGILQSLQGVMEKNMPQVSISLVSGNIYDTLEGIRLSYREAVAALDYRFIFGNSCVITQDMLTENQDYAFTYPYQFLNKLRMALLKGNSEDFKSVLNEIVSYIRDANFPLFYAKSVAYETIITCTSILAELGGGDFEEQLLKDNVVLLNDFDTIDELAEVLSNLCLKICDRVISRAQNTQEDTINQIKSYIQAHYSDPSFSIGSMAEQYNMTQVTISQYFKAQTGSTIIDYITGVRMEKARQLLIESDLSLDAIVESIGYVNTSSFIRRFKQLYGLTPRQYMNMWKKN